ncbi:MAG: hypothetical protein JNM76_07275 [Betaproteobacteria bacterium]|nr:hypothetical protein [Betaproteobacteria bacterium]
MRPTGKLILGGYFDFPFKVIATQSIGAINIRLHPSAAAALFPLGHNDLASRVWDLASLWPKSSAKLQRMLRDFDAPELLEAVLGMIRRAASGRGQMKPGVRRAVDVLSSHGGGGAVSALSTELGMSERNLYGLFQRSVCVPPKLFARISRFNRTLAELQPLHWRGERGIGAEEYFDESHRIREFAKFSGMTPRAYAQAAEDEGYRFSVLVK